MIFVYARKRDANCWTELTNRIRGSLEVSSNIYYELHFKSLCLWACENINY